MKIPAYIHTDTPPHPHPLAYNPSLNDYYITVIKRLCVCVCVCVCVCFCVFFFNQDDHESGSSSTSRSASDSVKAQAKPRRLQQAAPSDPDLPPGE